MSCRLTLSIGVYLPSRLRFGRNSARPAAAATPASLVFCRFAAAANVPILKRLEARWIAKTCGDCLGTSPVRKVCHVPLVVHFTAARERSLPLLAPEPPPAAVSRNGNAISKTTALVLCTGLVQMPQEGAAFFFRGQREKKATFPPCECAMRVFSIFSH